MLMYTAATHTHTVTCMPFGHVNLVVCEDVDISHTVRCTVLPQLGYEKGMMPVTQQTENTCIHTSSMECTYLFNKNFIPLYVVDTCILNVFPRPSKPTLCFMGESSTSFLASKGRVFVDDRPQEAAFLLVPHTLVDTTTASTG